MNDAKNLKKWMPNSEQRREQSEREVAQRVWPCLIKVFARNWPKWPNPTIPIFMLTDEEDDKVGFVQILTSQISALPLHGHIF